MKRVLVTGGCGFIGSEVVRQLVDRGDQVTVVDDLSKPGSIPKGGATFLELDLTDPEATLKVFTNHDYCIHLAAKIGGIGYFHAYPATILSENNRINSSVFSAAAQTGLSRIVVLSSSMVFESAELFPSKESDLAHTPVPRSAYGFSKLTSEWYARSFREEFGLEYTIVRPFNAYGPYEQPGDEVGYAHVIPDLIRKMLDGQYPLELLGDGAQTRCYTHVRDIASGVLTAMDHPRAANEDFNISYASEISVRELAELLWKILGLSRPFTFISIPAFKHDVRRRIPDVSKAKEFLGWTADITLEEGLPEVVEWVRQWYLSAQHL